MSYRKRLDFMDPGPEDIEKQRKALVWLIPLIIIQQGSGIFRNEASVMSQLVSTLAWGAVSIVLLWWLLGLPLRWMSDGERAILNDEWNQAVSADAARWAVGAFVLIGVGLMITRFFVPLDAGLAIFGLVNGAMLTAVARHAWLNRGEPDEDE